MAIEYLINGNRILHICDDVLRTFNQNRQLTEKSSESGGILLGKIKEESIFITNATSPGKGDSRGIFHFHRDKKRAQKIINETFKRSEGTLIYIGEWHTHRQQNPYPSCIDKFEIKRAFKKSKLNLDLLALVVVGTGNQIENLWVGVIDNKSLRQCEVLEHGGLLG